MRLHLTSILSVSLLTLALGASPAHAYSYPVGIVVDKPDLPLQTLEVSTTVVTASVERDGYSATSQAELDAAAAAKAAAEAQALAAAAAEEKKKADAEAAAAVAANAKSSKSSKTPSTGNLPSFTPDPGSAQSYAKEQIAARGWADSEFSCLVLLWNKESGWRANAANPSSGAYGIPQALPGSKMASAGADWATNANTQVDWGLGYITSRYKTPCGAWGHSQSVGWY